MADIVLKAAGRIVSVDQGDITLERAGVVRIRIGPEQVQRFERVGNDLQLVLKDGRTITIRGFFVLDEDGQRNDLVLEDEEGVLWWGQYSSPWSEFHFTEIQFDDSMLAAVPGGSGLPGWAIAVLAVVGGGLLQSLDGGGNDAAAPPPAPEPPVPTPNRAPATTDQAQSVAEDGSLSGQVAASDADGDPLTFAKGRDPAHGSVVVHSDGRYTYTPAPDFHGTDSFTVTISDGRGGTATSTVTVTVTPVNDAPTASAEPLFTDEDTPATGRVTAGDVDGDALGYSLGTPPAHGSVVLDPATGTYTYTPDPDFHGEDGFTVVVDDGHGGRITVTVPVTVGPVNEAPVASAAPLVTDEDTPASGTVSASDVDGDTLGYGIGSPPAHGSVALDPATGTYTYTPDPDFNGADSFTVIVDDGRGGSTTVTVPVTVHAVNDAPTASAEARVADEDTPVTGTVTARDVDGDALGYVVGTPPAHGSVALDPATGTYTYTPDPDFNGEDRFTVIVDDGRGGQVQVVVPVTVLPVNDAPVAEDLALSTSEDTAVAGTILASDPDGDTLSFVIATGPDHGTLSLDPGTGSFLYTPDADFNGSDRFTVTVSDGNGGTTTSTVSIGIAPVNDPPAALDAARTTGENTVLNGHVPAAVDRDGTVAGYTLRAGPGAGNGGLVFNADGSYRFDPGTDFDVLAVGQSRTVSFTYLATDNDGATSAPATITITVTGTNDAPVASDTTGTTEENTVLNGTLPTATDVDGTVASYQLVAGPGAGNGSVVVNANGSYTFTPGSDFDALPVGSSRDVTFTYTATDNDGGVSAPATVTITVTGTNDAPVATDTTGTTEENTVLNGTLPTATDVDGSIASYQLVSGPGAGNGSVTVNANGSYTFTPGSDFDALPVGVSRDITFTYTATDNDGGVSAPATVTITVTGTNDAPVATDSTGTTEENTVLNGTLPTATDVDGSIASYQLVSGPGAGNGSVVVNSNGSYTFTPGTDFDALAVGSSRDVTFTYTATDNDGGVSAPATITITVTGTNDAPVATDSTGTTSENTVLNGNVPAATDIDGTIASYQLVSGPGAGNGSVVVNANGSYTFTPGSDFDALATGASRDVTFTYTATDNNGAVSAPATVTITVTGTNDAPVATDSTGTTSENTVLNGNVPAATDVDGTIASYQLVAGPGAGNGSVVVNSNGSYTFTPGSDFDALAAGASRDVSFTYTATDNNGAVSAPATVTITVTGTNDAPVATAISQTTNEDAAGFSVDLLGTASDVDGGTLAVDSLTETSGRDASGVTLSGNSLVVDPAAYGYLAAGESVTLTYSYNVLDGQGGSTANTATLVIEGRNDVPVLHAASGILVKPQGAVHDSIANALSLDGLFALGNNPDVAHPDTVPFVSIHATAGGHVDYYAFTVTEAGTTATFDIDYAWELGNFDALLELRDASGALLASNDDSGTAAGGGGSVSYPGIDGYTLDSFLTWTFATPGTYYILVSDLSRGQITAGSPYQLQVSLPNAIMGTPASTVTERADGSADENTGNLTATGSLAFSDADLSNTHTASVALVSATDSTSGAATAIGGLTAVVGNSATGDGDGAINWTFTAAAGALDHLAEGQTLTQVYRVTVTDSSGATSSQDVTITLVGSNDAPVAIAGTGATGENTVLNGTLPVATDVDGTIASYQLVAGPGAGNGSVVVDANGSYTFTPGNDFAGLAEGATRDVSFTYTATDNTGAVSAPATVTITVTGTNNAPVAVADGLTVAEGGTATVLAGGATSVLANDSDAENDPLTAVLVTGPAHGSLTLNADGTFSYVHDGSETTADSFTYRANDGSANGSPVTVSITITPVNDAPVAVADGFTVAEGGTATVLAGGATSVLANDSDAENDPLTAVLVTGPAHGSLTLNANGTFSYVHDGSETTSDSFTYRANDGSANGNPVTVNITVTPVNDPPVAGNASGTTGENAVLNGTLPVATDVDGTIASYQLVAGPGAGNGSVVVNSNGSYTFTPGSDFDALGADDSRVVTFTYTATDNTGAVSAPATVTITVTGTNDAPVASAPSATTREDTAVSGQIDASDAEGDHLTYVIQAGVSNGSLLLNTATGAYTYTPNRDFNGSDSFTIRVYDEHGAYTDVTVPVTITSVNDAPVAGNATATTGENSVLDGTLPAATDVDGSIASYQLVAGPGAGNGSVVVNSDGSYTFTPGSDFDALAAGTSRNVTFTYTATDNDGAVSTPATVTITVTGTNDAPAATDTTATTAENTVLSGTLPTATDVDGTIASYQLVAGPGAGNGSVVVNANGSYTFTPGSDFDALAAGASRDVTFTYTATDNNGAVSAPATVTITVTGTNDAPVATAISQTTNEDAAGFSMNLLGTASDVDGGTLAIAGLTETSGGDASGVSLSGSSLVVDPSAYNHLAAGESVTLSYAYNVTDGQGGSVANTATLVIEGRNDAPVTLPGNGVLVKPQGDSHASLATALSLDGLFVLGNNPDVADPDTVPYVSVHAAGSGAIDYYVFTVTQAGSQAVFDIDYARTPDGGGFDALIRLLDSNGNQLDWNDDSLPGAGGGGSVDVGDGRTTDAFLTYTFAAPGTYYLEVRDAGVAIAAGAPYQLQVSLQDALMASPREATLTERADGSADENTGNLTATGSIAFSDADLANTHTTSVVLVSATDSVSGPATAIGGLTAVVGNAATGDGEGRIDWSFSVAAGALDHLAEGQTLVQVYRVTVTDNSGATSSQDVTITLVGNNDAPVATGTTATTGENAVLNGTVPAATDVDGTIASYQLASGPGAGNGSVVVNANGSYTFTPGTDFDALAPGASRNVSFTYTVTDNDGSVSAPATVTITVTGTNDMPVATDTTATTGENAVLNGTVPAATDVDGTIASYQLASGPGAGNGSVVVNANGSYTFTPGSDFDALAAGSSRQVSFTYTATDNHGGVSAPATVTITVTGTNDAPVAADDSITVAEGGTATVLTGGATSVLANDTDAEGDALGAVLVSDVSNGTLTLNADGTFSYIHDGSETTSDSFTYRANDGTVDGNLVTVNIAIAPVNDAPVNTLPASWATSEDTAVTLGGMAVADSDAGTGTMRLTLEVGSGSLTGTATAGVTVSGSGTGTLVIEGSQAALNTWLSDNAPTYLPALDAKGDVTLTMTSNDQGSSGNGGAQGDVDTATISIAAIADTPQLVLTDISVLHYGSTVISTTGADTVAGNSAQGVTRANLELELGVVDGWLNNRFNPAPGAGGVIHTGFVTIVDGKLTESHYTLSAGGTVSWTHTFTNGENSASEIQSGYNDILVLLVTHPDGSRQPILVDASETKFPTVSSTDTTTFTATQSGNYTFHWLVLNSGDNAKDSSLQLSAPSFTVPGTAGAYGASIEVPLSAITRDSSGSENLTVTISGLPAGAIFSAGTNNGDGTWSFTSAQLAGLTLLPPAAFAGQIVLTVTATATEPSSGSTSSSTGTVTIDVARTVDTSSGTEGANTLNGGAGNDLIRAYAGNDIVNGGGGQDLIFGGAGNDTLNGEEGNDHLYGGVGNDILVGGIGNDTLIGGAGADIFRWQAGHSGHDIIRDFSVAQGDRIDLTGLPSNYSLSWAAAGSNTVLTITDQNGAAFATITVENVTQAALQAPGIVQVPAATAQPVTAGFTAEALGLGALGKLVAAVDAGTAAPTALPDLADLLPDHGGVLSLEALFPTSELPARGSAVPTGSPLAGSLEPSPPVSPGAPDELDQPILALV